GAVDGGEGDPLARVDQIGVVRAQPFQVGVHHLDPVGGHLAVGRFARAAAALAGQVVAGDLPEVVAAHHPVGLLLLPLAVLVVAAARFLGGVGGRGIGGGAAARVGGRGRLRVGHARLGRVAGVVCS